MPFTYLQFNTEELEARVIATEHAAELQAQEIMSKIVNKAGTQQRLDLANAITATGEERVRSGGKSSDFGSTSPGRVDSGQMINTASAHTQIAGGIIAGEWGWLDPEQYYMYQDWGTDDGIPAAHSLFNTFVVAREELFAEVLDLANGAEVEGVA